MKDMLDLSAKEIAETINKHTKKNVYITVDLDVLDNGEMPSVGTPEPNGMKFWQMDAVLKDVLAEKNLLGIPLFQASLWFLPESPCWVASHL